MAWTKTKQNVTRRAISNLKSPRPKTAKTPADVMASGGVEGVERLFYWVILKEPDWLVPRKTPRISPWSWSTAPLKFTVFAGALAGFVKLALTSPLAVATVILMPLVFCPN